MRPFATLAEFILEPLAGRGDDDWHRSVNGAWTPGQVVDHLAVAIENSARGFAARADKPPMQRRPRPLLLAAATKLVFGTGYFPPGRKAPPTALPAETPDRAATERRLRDGVAAFLDLERRLLPARRRDLFLKHPVFGDLTLEEFMTFHVRHAEHHRRQIVSRLGAG